MVWWAHQVEQLTQETERLREALAQAKSRAHSGAQALQVAKVDRALSTQTLQEVSSGTLSPSQASCGRQHLLQWHLGCPLGGSYLQNFCFSMCGEGA